MVIKQQAKCDYLVISVFFFIADIDECKSNPCTQICTNTVGTYICSCNKGYTLQADGTTCLRM